MQLRDYQARCVDDVIATSDNVGIVMPTGGGKTATVAAVCSHYKSVWWGAHRQELVDQARAALQLWAPNTGRTCMTVQSVKEDSSHEYDLMVFDELHHIPAECWSTVTKFVRHKRFVGMTATPRRSDGKGLKPYVDRLVIAATYAELLERELLVPCQIAHPSGVPENGLGANPLQAWLKCGQDRLTLAFAPNKELATKWCDEFKTHGIESECVFGTTVNREALLDRFRSGAIRVLWNVGVLTEGFDVPEVGCVLLARSVKETELYMQIVGRGLRPAPGKTDMILIDLADAFVLHGAPTDDREYSLADDLIKRRAPKIGQFRQCLGCGSLPKAWQRKCPFCGYEADIKHPALRVLNNEMLMVYQAEITPIAVRAKVLEFLRGEQKKRGLQLNSVIKQYKELFGCAPHISDATPAEKARYFKSIKVIGPAAPWVYRTIFGELPAGFKRSQKVA